MNSVQGNAQSAIAWSDERQRAHAEKLTALASFAQRYRAFLDAMAAGDVKTAERILALQRSLVFVVVALFVAACGGQPFVAGDASQDAHVVTIFAPSEDAGAGDARDEVLEELDAGELVDVDGDKPAHAVEGGELVDAGDAGDVATAIAVDAGDANNCTLVRALAYPVGCTTAVNGDCAPGSLDCVWTKFLCAAGSCCRLDPLPNDCHACAETFNCACLAALDAGMCCDTDAGPYLGFRCP